jgi:hypothetical protein
MRAREIICDSARDPCLSEKTGDVVRARFRPSAKLPENDLAVVNMINDSRLDTVQAHETQTTHDLLHRQKTGKLLLVPKPILESQADGGRPHQRRQKLRQLIIRCGLQRDEDQVRDPYVLGSPRAFRLYSEIALLALDKYAPAPHDLVVRTQEEVNLASSAREFRSIETSYRPATHDRDSHDIEFG